MRKPKPEHLPFYLGEKCPYCSRDAKLVDSHVVYGTSFGKIMYCQPCHAWVGVHKHSEVPLGRLAKYELREAKKLAHKHFDPLWRNKEVFQSRSSAYKWLSKALNIHPEFTHIGMFNVATCLEVVRLCEALVNVGKVIQTL